MTDWLTWSWGGNTLRAYLLSVALLAGGMLVVTVLRDVVLRRLARAAGRSRTPVDDFVVLQAARNGVPILLFGVLYLATRHLALASWLEKALQVVGVALVTFFVTRFLAAGLTFLLTKGWTGERDETARKRGVVVLLPVLKAVLWTLAVLALLDNLGFEITTIVAGLGIGGVAVALAAQAILSDLFSYVAIVFDQPFEVGDFILLDDSVMGTVEHVGIKTTRLRSLGGEQIVLANSDLTSSRIRNFKRMQERRVLLRIGVTYDTPAERLERAVAIVKDVLAATPDVRADRVHFKEFGDSSLGIEAVYFVLSADYNRYMDVQERVNLAVLRAFGAEGLEFAFPTRTVHVVQ